jgi:hypothetical protein
MLEVDREQSDLPGNPGTGILPTESPRDHQMEDKEEIARGLDGDALAETMEIDDGAAFEFPERRVDGPQQERRRQSYAGDPPPDDSRPQRVEVEEDVRQLWHSNSVKRKSKPGLLWRHPLNGRTGRSYSGNAMKN